MSRLLVSIAALTFGAGAAAGAAEVSLPHLEHRGQATQLIVDGEPWLIRGGELNNTVGTDAAYLDGVWPQLTELNLNTVLVGIGWDWIEPTEGQFDFSVVDRVLAGARKHGQRLIFLWFGSWKNGVSTFAPAWVKADTVRFPRVRTGSGVAIEMLSTSGAATLEAETRAYRAFLEHLARADRERTVLMIQLENEVGIAGDSRDRSAAASEAFARPVPAELMQWLEQHRGSLSPALLAAWRAAGGQSSGNWQTVFGKTLAADEIFMAWNYARYMGQLAAAGKSVEALPVFTNSWLASPGAIPGDYPSGGPDVLTFDIWKAAAPQIDLNCPDISVANFDQIVRAFHRPDNPLFIPEGLGIGSGVANVFYAVGAQQGLGYSVFGIDNTVRLIMFPPVMGAAPPEDLPRLPLARGYAALRELTPLILAHQATGTIDAAWLNPTQPSQDIELGGYRLHVELRRTFWDQKTVADLGYALVVAAGADEFFIAGSDVQVTFRPTTPGPAIAGLAADEAGHFVAGRWVVERLLNGDDIMLNYKVTQQAALRLSGSGARFGPDGPSIQHVRLYRYEP
jgi:hypothetical protein